MSDNPLSGKVGLDTTDFKTGVASMNRELRVLESSFRANAASLGNWGQSASGLEMRIGSLTKQMDVQQRKVEATRKEYERIKAEKGETSAAAQNLAIKLNKETESLNKMQNELNQSETQLREMANETDRAGDEAAEMGRKQEQAANKSKNFGQVMGGLKGILKGAATAIAAVAAAAVGLAIGLGRVIGSAMETAGELVDMSNQTGISVERLQEMEYAGQQLGVSTDTISGAMARLTRNMASGNEAFDELGVSTRDASGNLRDNEAVFADALTALGGVANETERDALAMELFGKSAQELNPLIKAGADEIAALREEAHEMGAVMEDEDVNALEALGDTLAGLQAGLKGTMGTIAASFAPGLQGLADVAKGYMGELAGIVSGADGDMGAMASGIGELLGRVLSDVAKQAPQMLQAGLGILQGLFSAIVANLPTLVNSAIQIIMSLVNFLIQNLPMLIQAGITLLVTVATGIAQALPELIPAIVQIIPTIITILLENLPLLIDAALQLIIALAQGLITALPTLIESVPEIVTAIFDALIAALPMIGEAALELIITLVEGIGEALPMIGEAAGDLINALVGGLQSLNQTLMDTGSNLVTGVWNGIQSRAAWFAGQLKAFFSGIWEKVKDSFDMHSPSRRTAREIGKPMAEGVGVGFVEQLARVRQDVQLAMNGLVVAPAGLAAAGAGGGSGGWGNLAVQMQVNINVDKISNAVDVREMANEVADIAVEKILQRARN